MIRGELYLASDPELVAGRLRARKLWRRFNQIEPEDDAQRDAILRELFGHVGQNVLIEPPFYCDYGDQIELDDFVFANFNCVFLDSAPIRIGANTKLGPNVQILTADHPRDAELRASGPELAHPIEIGSRVWIGGGVIVCPGVTIGDDTIIGAGSVVIRDIPSGVVAAGNPCRVIRRVDAIR